MTSRPNRICGTTTRGVGDSEFEHLQYTYEKVAFDVTTRCPVNQPVLTKSFTDWGAATAFINLDRCSCSLYCIFGQPDEAPGMAVSLFDFNAGKSYWNHGANRVEGPVSGETTTPAGCGCTMPTLTDADFQSMADSTGIPMRDVPTSGC